MRVITWRRIGAVLLATTVLPVACGEDSGPNETPSVDAGATCPTASTCSGRQYCNDAKTCLCIRTAEGVNRCGAIPSCGTQRCKTSADCKNLGEGYFCDSPKSGCCGLDEGLCIPPCADLVCPPPRVCGNSCCPENTTCIDGACCPAARVCGDACCAVGEQCSGGTCTRPDACVGASCAPRDASSDAGAAVDPCAHDPVTEASLRAAFTALAGGATTVSVSPGGCITYRRTLTGDAGRLTSETFIVGGRTLTEVTHTDSGAQSRQDKNRDFFFERLGTVTRAEAGADLEAEADFRELDPRTSAVIRRERRSTAGASVRVVVEDQGQIIQQYATPLEQQKLSALAADLPPGSTCDTDRALRYHDRLVKCLAQTPKCLTEHRRDDLANELRQLGFKTNILCVNDPSNSALASNPGSWRAGVLARSVTIKINTARMDAATEALQVSTICHELMHSSSLGGHDPVIQGSTQGDEADAVTACEALCGFNFGQQPTKCQCATCTGTDVCDSVCSGYKDCQPNLGAYCPCPQRNRWYATLTECRAECPSGLGCFGYSRCLDLDKSCQ